MMGQGRGAAASCHWPQEPTGASIVELAKARVDLQFNMRLRQGRAILGVSFGTLGGSVKLWDGPPLLPALYELPDHKLEGDNGNRDSRDRFWKECLQPGGL
jgi:hypothetical protein